MNNFSKKIVFLATLLCSGQSFAQIKNLAASKDVFKGSSGVTCKRIDDNSIAFVSGDNKTVDISCTDNNLKSKWTASVKGFLKDSERLGNNLLVMVSTDFTFFTRENSTYKAYLLDGENGKLIKEKIIYSGNNDYLTVPYSMISKDHQRYTLAARQTAIKRNVKIAPGALAALYVIQKTENESRQNKAFSVQTFDKDLEVQETIFPVLPAGDFIGIDRTINNDLYIAVSENRKGITISKYLPGKEVAEKKITEPYSFYSGWLNLDHLNDHVKFFADTINNNTAYISGSFRNDDEFISLLNKYDFSSDQHKKFKKVFTKDYLKTLEKEYTPVNSKFKKLSLAHPKTIKMGNVTSTASGYFVVLSDDKINDAKGTTPWHLSDGLIVYSLDKDLQIKTTTAVPRNYIGAISAEHAVYEKNGSFYVLGSHDKNASFISARISSATGKIEELQALELPDSGKSDIVKLENILFSDKNIIIPGLTLKLSLTRPIYSVDLYSMGW